MQLLQLVPLLILTTFVGLSVLFYVKFKHTEREQNETYIEQMCLRHMNATRSEIRGGTTVLYALKELVDVSNAVNPGELWWQFATDIIGKTGWRLIGSGILQKFTGPGVAEWQSQSARNATQQSTSGAREPVTLDRSDYLIIVENFPNRTSLGFDYYSEPERASVVRLGIQTQNLTVSNPTTAINSADRVLIFFIPIWSHTTTGVETFWGGISGAYYARNTLPTLSEGISLRLQVNERLAWEDPSFAATSVQNYQSFVIADKSAKITCGYNPTKSSTPYLFLGLGIASGLLLTCFSIFMLRQISSRRRALVERMKADEERALAQERETAAVNNTKLQTTFLANMSHEVRTPLNGIMWMINFMLRTPLQPEQREYMDNLESSSTALLQIVNDVLDLSKIEANKLEIEHIPVDIVKLLQSITTTQGLTASQKHNTFTAEITVPFAERHIITDPTRLTQVINNLISNALKFSNGKVILRCSRHEETLIFSVVDNGIGMTDEQVSNLFQPFVQADSSTTRRFGGTGLGLSICKKLVLLLGGDISCTTVPNKGSTFTFWIPYVAADRGELELLRQVERSDAVLFKGNILLAEDNLINQKVTNKVLKDQFGLNIDCVDNGQQAIDRISANPSRYDLVLMDGHMPVADGYEATRKLRDLGIRVPIVAFSASAMDVDKERAYAAGMDDFLSKPVVKADLARLLFKYLQPL